MSAENSIERVSLVHISVSYMMAGWRTRFWKKKIEENNKPVCALRYVVRWSTASKTWYEEKIYLKKDAPSITPQFIFIYAFRWTSMGFRKRFPMIVNYVVIYKTVKNIRLHQSDNCKAQLLISNNKMFEFIVYYYQLHRKTVSYEYFIVANSWNYETLTNYV